MKTVVITGAGGYIGGQTAIKFSEKGYQVIGIDRNAPRKDMEQFFKKFLISDFASEEALHIIKQNQPHAIVHCAGTSLVGPSVKNPSPYYDNNFVKTKRLLDFLVQEELSTKVIFSSSASTYGEPVMSPCSEEDPTMPLSPYGESKLMCEFLLKSYKKAYQLDSVIFRYFNVCGADSQGRHGQETDATHLIARVLQAIKTGKDITIFGDDYFTPDGTCVRDYVHVEDIANAHYLAAEKVVVGVFNLGTEAGYSNKQIINTALQVTGATDKEIKIGPARTGDPAVLVGSSTRFTQATGWKNSFDLQQIIKTAWQWYNK